MSNLIKTEVYLPKNFHLYQIPEIFNKPFEIKEEVFELNEVDPYKLYVVIGDDREKEKLSNAVFWNSLGGALLFESEYQKKYSTLELKIWDNVEKSLSNLAERLADFEKKTEGQTLVDLSSLYHFNNHLLMYDGDDAPFDYFLDQISWKESKAKKQELVVLTDVTQGASFKKVDIPEVKITEFALMYALYLKDLGSMKRKKTLKDSLKLIEEFFNKMSVPIAVFDEFNDLVLLNKKFRDLELITDEVLGYKDNQTLDQQGELFTVSVKSIVVEAKEYRIFTFHKGGEKAQSLIQMEEMGVITSSIAHELNNPIGGVLTGTEVLTSLDFGISPDGVEILKEIHKSSIRCRNLIKTFLGFARQEMNNGHTGEVEDAIDQALSFLRTRFMELGFKLQIEYKGEGEFEIHNLSLWTMIFYSYFTSILNNISRESLVQDMNISEVLLTIKLSSSSIQLTSVSYDLSRVGRDLSQSSFFQHLLSSTHVELTSSNEGTLFNKTN